MLKGIRSLSPQEEKFIDFYFNEAKGVAIDAYRLAYPKIPRPAHHKVYSLMKREAIKQAIKDRKEQIKYYKEL